MGLVREARCPSCETARTFRRIAKTTLHLGEKIKWSCTDCGFRTVRIDGVVDTARDE